MKKAKDTVVDKKEEIVEEKEGEEEGTETKELPGLSLRDALEVAIVGTKEPEKDEKERTDVVRNRTDDVKPPIIGGKEKSVEPPAEYTKEEKEDFLQLSPKGQEAQLRLDKSRKSKIEEIKAETVTLQRQQAENEWVKDLAKEITPYLKSVGEKRPAHEALILALKMRQEFENGDPKQSAAAYLKAKGIQPPAELLTGSTQQSVPDEKIIPLQKDINDIKIKIAQEEQVRRGTILNQAWIDFEQEKNAAGLPKFPDTSGLELARNIGSLVGGITDESKQFIARARSMIPDLTYPKLLKRAYEYCGGRVDDSEATKTQASQKHIIHSKRAASSIPGRGAPTQSSGTVKKYKTYREAAEAALSDLNSE